MPSRPSCGPSAKASVGRSGSCGTWTPPPRSCAGEASGMRRPLMWRSSRPSVARSPFHTGAAFPALARPQRRTARSPTSLPDADFHRPSVAAKMGLHGALAFPVWSERGVTGIMVFFSRHVHPPDQDLLKIMADIGSRIGQFIKRKRGEEALTRQAEELARLGQEAQVREAFIRNVVESIQDGIIVLDRQGRITEWNRAMEEGYRIPAAEVRGQSILEVFPSLRAEGFEVSLGRILEENEEVTLERCEHETRHRRRVTMNIKGS